MVLKGRGAIQPGKAAGAVKSQMPLKQLSSYVMNLANKLGGSRGRAYKSCIFGTGMKTPKPGHVARCNRRFFGTPKVKAGKKRRGRIIARGAKQSRIAGGTKYKAGTRRALTTGPGQRGAPKGARRGTARRTEGR